MVAVQTRIAAVAFLAAGVGLTFIGQANAATSPSWYVTSSTTNCSDQGPGTAAAPFCSVEHASSVAQPGQVVKIIGTWTDRTMTIDATGTDAAPVTFEGSALINGGTTLTIDGSHDVVLSGLGFSDAGIAVISSSGVTVRQNRWSLNNVAWVGSYIDVAAAGTTVIDNSLASALGVGITVEAGATGTVVANNTIDWSAEDGIDVRAANVAVTNNSVLRACATGIDIAASAANASVENNVISNDRVSCTTAVADIGVEGAATATATVDYNMTDPTTAFSPYRWDGTNQTTLAAFGQGAHDIGRPAALAPALFDAGSYASPAVDSANSSAPGFQATDEIGHARVDNPLVTNKGTGSVAYADRGAMELQPSPPQASANETPAAVVLVTGDPHPTWRATFLDIGVGDWAPITAFAIDYGDGSTASHTPVPGQQLAGDFSAEDTHLYTSPGLYTATLKVTDALGQSATVALTFDAREPTLALLPDTNLKVGTPFQVLLGTAAGVVGPVTTLIDFGDGTTATSDLLLFHSYSTAGTFKITGTVTDATQRTLTVSTSVTIQATTTPPPPSPIGLYKTVGPVRVLDTRSAIGVKTTVAIPSQHTVVLQVAGLDGVPATGVRAVVLNVTATQGTSSGYVTAYPDGMTRPTASNLNWKTGETIPNLTVVPVINGKIDLYNGSTGSVHLIADLTGYYNSASGDPFSGDGPDRIFDTRIGSGGVPKAAIKAHQTLRVSVKDLFDVQSTTGVFVPKLDAVTLNVTVTQPTTSGYLTVYPDGITRPTVSNLNWTAKQTIPNMVTVPVHNGYIDFYNGSSGTIQLLADQFGYYASNAQTQAFYVPSGPTRVLDTRNATGVSTSTPVGPNKTVTFHVDRNPADFPGANEWVVLNVTVTQPSNSGYLQVTSFGPTTASNLNWSAGETIANLVVAPIDGSGNVTLFNGSSGTVHVIADDYGTFASRPQ